MRVLLWFVHEMPNCNVLFFLIAQLQIVLFLCFSFLQVMIIIEGVDIEDLQEKMESGRYRGDSFCDEHTYMHMYVHVHALPFIYSILSV